MPNQRVLYTSTSSQKNWYIDVSGDSWRRERESGFGRRERPVDTSEAARDVEERRSGRVISAELQWPRLAPENPVTDPNPRLVPSGCSRLNPYSSTLGENTTTIHHNVLSEGCQAVAATAYVLMPMIPPQLALALTIRLESQLPSSSRSPCSGL